MNKYSQAIARYLQDSGHSFINLKAVLFDMDGVLFNSMPYHAEAWHHATKKYGLNLSREEAYMHEGRTGAGTIHILHQREFGINASEELVKQIYEEKSKIFNSFPEADVMNGAAGVLQKVIEKGLVPVLVTGSGQKSLLDKLSLHFPNTFCKERMVTAFDVKLGKPNPEPYMMGLQKAGVAPNEAIVIENAPIGIEAGVSAGIFTIAVNTGPLKNQILWDAGANLLFNSMTDFYNHWEELFLSLKNTAV